MIKYYGILLLSILLTTVVQATLKAISVKYNGSFFDSLFDFKLYFVILLYGIVLVTWFTAAAKIPFTVLIPANVLTIVLGGFIGYFLFGEEFSFYRILAYLIIILGILVLMLDAYKN
tara:strand:- start:186 stop:536 length:351 start_codon:yes stop_codon:yes gene_type:complete